MGHSFGATLGGVLAGIEKRIKAYVLMAGLVAYSGWCRTSDYPWAKWLRETLYLAALERDLTTVEALFNVAALRAA